MRQGEIPFSSTVKLLTQGRGESDRTTAPSGVAGPHGRAPGLYDFFWRRGCSACASRQLPMVWEPFGEPM